MCHEDISVSSVTTKQLSAALWRLYHRSQRPFPFTNSGNLPYDDPAFSTRMLVEHLDESHAAASRTAVEREAQIGWMTAKLGLTAVSTLLDVTCGPGLYAIPFAKQGVQVTGIDFAPAAIAHARELAEKEGARGLSFIQQDIRQMELPANHFDAAILLYGQLAVMTKDEAQAVLSAIVKALKPNGRLLLEMLHPDHVDKSDSNWWYTDDTGLWGDAPFLHLGERFWDADERVSIERYHILHLDSGQMDEIELCDQLYEPDEMREMMKKAGMGKTAVFPAWGELSLYDAGEWIVYIGEKKQSTIN